jgi:hypothetical protein
MTTYTTAGSVRGTCGHNHKTIVAAEKCLQSDRDGCGSQGGYSDRQIVRADGQALTDDDRAALELHFAHQDWLAGCCD